jgi:ATP adenylyltransferase
MKKRAEREPRGIIWAPWRFTYIVGKKEKGCLFCRKAKSRDDRKNHVLFRGAFSYVLLNTYPYTSGHLLIAPYRHAADLEVLPPEEAADLMRTAQACLKVLKQAMKPEGFNIGFNLGQAAGAGVRGHLHLHLHVVPRWNGDTNFMPVLGRARVIPQSLDATYDLLVKSLAARRHGKPRG